MRRLRFIIFFLRYYISALARLWWWTIRYWLGLRRAYGVDESLPCKRYGLPIWGKCFCGGNHSARLTHYMNPHLRGGPPFSAWSCMCPFKGVIWRPRGPAYEDYGMFKLKNTDPETGETVSVWSNRPPELSDSVLGEQALSMNETKVAEANTRAINR